MGCASSTPMIQTTGSEMLKAATHVASDATKTAEDTVEGITDSVGKTLETAKDSVAATVESVKHEVENVVKEKTELLEDAKNSLVEKFHTKQTENEGNSENKSKADANIEEMEMDELKIQLNENLKHSNGNSVEAASSTSNLKQTAAMKEITEHVLTRTDTETDSLKTSTPEPEIEQALAKSYDNQEDGDNNPPTPKPTLSELENLTAEAFKHQQQQEGTIMVSDTKMTNDSLIAAMHENIKPLDSNNMMSLTAENNTIKQNESTNTTPTINDIKSNVVHNTTQISTAVHVKRSQVLTYTQNAQPLLPLTIATSVIATNTCAARVQPKVGKEKENLRTLNAAPILTTQKPSPFAPLHQAVAGNLKNNKVNKKEDLVVKRTDSNEKRPRTTEWEKFADMLAQIRKFNPHDAIRRGGTFSKFGGSGFGQLRERRHARNAMEDDGSDTTSNFRGSPLNSQCSSARADVRVQHRPKTGHNRRNSTEFSAYNGGGKNISKARRNSNVSSTIGRKFDFNPTRPRVIESVSSISVNQTFLPTQMPYAPYSNLNESVKSPANKRSQHSRNETTTLPRLETLERTRSRFQQESIAQNHHHQHLQHFEHDYVPFVFDHNDSSMPLQNDIYSNKTRVLTRQSSNTSLFSNCSYVDNVQPLDERLLSTTHHPPVKNTSSFLTTPRSSPFSLRKSYTDLYFSTTGNKENKPNASSDLGSKDKSSRVYSKKNFS